MGNGKSLYIVGRGVLTPLFCEDPLYPLCFFVGLFLCLNRWSCPVWCAILLNDNMDLHMLILSTLVPEGPWCVFYATRCQVYWGLTDNVFFLLALWFDITHTNTHTALSEANRLNTHITIYLHHLLYAHSSYIY